jgi:Xaa-Pro aminopeptidase
MNSALQERANRLFRKLDERGIEAALIFDIHNIRYFTGFTGSEGTLLASKGRMCLLVDGRYTTQARVQAPKAEVLQFKQKIPAVAEIVNKEGFHSIAVEASSILYSQYLELSDCLPRVEIKPLGSEISAIRASKDRDEVDLIRKAAVISGKALDSLRDMIKPGISERDLALELEYRMGRSGAEGASFETIVASGENSALPHARPSARKLREGDFVIFDYGGICGGYHSDETVTFGIGQISKEQVKVYNIVKEAHDRALAQVRQGVSCKVIDETARAFIDQKGFGENFVHGTGHGVGLEVHEFPRISFLGDDILESGMVITIEPGVYISGSFGVRIESLVLVCDNGCEVLSYMDKGLNIIN